MLLSLMIRYFWICYWQFVERVAQNKFVWSWLVFINMHSNKISLMDISESYIWVIKWTGQFILWLESQKLIKIFNFDGPIHTIVLKCIISSRDKGHLLDKLPFRNWTLTLTTWWLLGGRLQVINFQVWWNILFQVWVFENNWIGFIEPT